MPISLTLVWDAGMLGMRLVVCQDARADLTAEQKIIIYKAKA